MYDSSCAIRVLAMETNTPSLMSESFVSNLWQGFSSAFVKKEASVC